jgi:integrase
MPAKRKKERILATHFVWLLGQRSGVYYADGRSNRPSAGRHSLGTKEYEQAREALKRLDLVQAVALGKADRALLDQAPAPGLSLTEGRRLYLEHVQRPRVVGGARPVSAQRYQAVFDKFDAFAQAEGITTWNGVTRSLLESYAAHLDDQGYAYATEYLELTTLKQAVKWLVQEGRLPAACRVHLPLNKPQGTTTYCWRTVEVQALLQRCQQHPDFAWLGAALTALACTGLRISELAALRWSDVDLEDNLVHLTDETTQSQRRPGKARSTKSGRSRSFPIHADLRRVLSAASRTVDGLIFHGPKGGKLKPDTVRRALIRELLTPLAKQFPASPRASGFRDGRLHSFRHFFCSTCANSGVPEQVVMAWLGHRDSAMVRHYYHLHDEEAQRQMKRLKFLGRGAGVAARKGKGRAGSPAVEKEVPRRGVMRAEKACGPGGDAGASSHGWQGGLTQS